MSEGAALASRRTSVALLAAMLSASLPTDAKDLCLVHPSRVFDNGLKHRCVVMRAGPGTRGGYQDQSECQQPRNEFTKRDSDYWQLAFASGGKTQCNAFLTVNDPNGNIFARLERPPGGPLRVHLAMDYTHTGHPCAGKHFDWIALQSRSSFFPRPEQLFTNATVEPRVSAGVKEAKFLMAIKGDKKLANGDWSPFVLGVHFFRRTSAPHRHSALPSLVTARRCEPSEPCDESVHVDGSYLGYAVAHAESRELSIDWGRVLAHVNALSQEGRPVFRPYTEIKVTAVRVGIEPRGARRDRHELVVSGFKVLTSNTEECSPRLK